jgi:hypothetical protein
LQKEVSVTFDPLNSSYLLYVGQRYVNALSTFSGIGMDASGNVYISGFLHPVGVKTNTALIAKLDSAGRVLWAKQFPPTTYGSVLTDIRVLANGNLVVGGAIGDASAPSVTGIVLVLSPNGDLVKTFFYQGTGGTKSPVISDLDVDQNGNAFIIGSFAVNPDMDLDRFIAKIDLNTGAVLWQLGDTIANSSADQTRDQVQVGLKRVRVDNSGSVYVNGLMYGYNADPSQGYVGQYMPINHLTKIAANGTESWTVDYGRQSLALLVTQDGNVAIGGQLVSQGLAPQFVAKFSPAGQLVTARVFGAATGENGGLVTGLSERSDGTLIASGLTIDSSGKAFGAVTSVDLSSGTPWSLRYTRTKNDAFMVDHLETPANKIWFPATTTAPDGYTSLMVRLDDASSQSNCSECFYVTGGTFATPAAVAVPASLNLTAPLPYTAPGFNGISGPVSAPFELLDLQMTPEVQ